MQNPDENPLLSVGNGADVFLFFFFPLNPSERYQQYQELLFPFRWYLVTVGKANVVPAVLIAWNALISPSHFTGSI